LAGALSRLPNSPLVVAHRNLIMAAVAGVSNRGTPGLGEKANMRKEISMRGDNPVPDWLRARVDAVVWDFDLTILRIHSYSSRIRSREAVASRDLGADFADLEFF